MLFVIPVRIVIDVGDLAVAFRVEFDISEQNCVIFDTL